MKVKIQLTNTYYKSVDLEIDINHQRYEEHKLKYPNLSMEDYLLENEGEYTHDIDDMMSEASLEWADSEWKYETEDEEGSLEEPLTSDFDKKTNKMKKVIDFYNETTAEEKCYLLLLMAKDIMIPIRKEDGIHCLGLDEDAPVCLNGTAFQINTEELYENVRDSKLYKKLKDESDKNKR